MNRTLIVARIRPGTEQDVAHIFAESDATSLPADIGVAHRSLYSLQDLYVHLIEMEADPAESIRRAQNLPGFRDVSARLSQFITPYDPATWRSPRDAQAREFYRWPAR